jgi:short-subunit dehydrogenase
MIRRPLIVGGANGIGLAIATALAEREEVEVVYIVDCKAIDTEYRNPKFQWMNFNLCWSDYSFFDRFSDVDSLIITSGFGSLKLFQDIDEEEIIRYFQVNAMGVIRIIRKFYDRINSTDAFPCCVMVSIAGSLPSPWLSVYGATKAALKSFIQSVNVELRKGGSVNQILDVSPGHIDGTSFSGGKTDLDKVLPLAEEILKNLEEKRDLFIPQYYEVYQEVLRRSYDDFRAEGERSYEYKKSRL